MERTKTRGLSKLARERLIKIQKWVDTKALSHLIIDDLADLFYFTGLNLSLGRLVIEPADSILYVDGRYFEIAKKNAPCKVLPLSEFSKIMPENLGFDSTYTSYLVFQEFEKAFPNTKLSPIRKPTLSLRMIKEKKEIALLREAQRLTFRGFEHVSKKLKEGISEEELSFEFEFFCRKNGASSLSFSPIVAFGENGAYPHHRSGPTKLKKDTAVLFDLGCVVNHYAGDMTRVIFFGKPNEQIEKDYELVKKAQKKAIELVKPGALFGEIDKKARSIVKEYGAEKLFIHGLSHGIGLEVHEEPRLKIKSEGDTNLSLEPGMAFSVEPGIYREGLGGVRYEDIVVVTEEGYEIL